MVPKGMDINEDQMVQRRVRRSGLEVTWCGKTAQKAKTQDTGKDIEYVTKHKTWSSMEKSSRMVTDQEVTLQKSGSKMHRSHSCALEKVGVLELLPDTIGRC